ncbi:hypothetical protein [Dyadobacter aurulentus]|uniref:hypothetical protein n=1 Tax=Dyadobacter sp. UC 10 TaxID=2605428 RepID=UPI0011F38B33|nr:hypothetical protein [Dyadobacter sp. UC 10]KAA0993640.1 hypothetical protein FXO21_27430 [Dyadobacter sp. UC 10]
MKNSIEEIWKNGFLNETSLVVPKINDLYNQRSKHVVDKVKRMFRFNQMLIVVMSILLPVIHYFVDALWQGIAASILLLVTFWYNNKLIYSIETLDQGTTSFEYLQSFDRWLEDILSKCEKIARFSYPLYVLISISTIWSAWYKQGIILKIHHRFPDLIFIGNVPLIAIMIAGAMILLMSYFSVRIYKWEVGMMYGRVFGKLKETIAEMEKLKQGE